VTTAKLLGFLPQCTGHKTSCNPEDWCAAATSIGTSETDCCHVTMIEPLGRQWIRGAS
jgi:hypothetical protein